MVGIELMLFNLICDFSRYWNFGFNLFPIGLIFNTNNKDRVQTRYYYFLSVLVYHHFNDTIRIRCEVCYFFMIDVPIIDMVKNGGKL